jgi:hypothetical protein
MQLLEPRNLLRLVYLVCTLRRIVAPKLECPNPDKFQQQLAVGI